MPPAGDRDGYWGSTTSTLDWCEENYAVTMFIAEFWNTVSNLIMIIPPIFGAIQSISDRLEKRYIAAYLALTVVGMGSWCFHMTLKYEMQLLDELPMIYSCCIFVYCMFECFKMKSSINYHLLFTLVLFSLIVTTIYLKVKEPIFHQVMYGVLVFTLVLRSIYIVTWFTSVVPFLELSHQSTSATLFCLSHCSGAILSPEFSIAVITKVLRAEWLKTFGMHCLLGLEAALRLQKPLKDKATRKRFSKIFKSGRVYPWLRGLGYTSLTIFLLGFLLWNIDNIFCDSLRNFRKRVHPVLGVTTQFHAWWHILTGLGSYLHILFSLYTRTLYLRYRPKVKFLFGIWPVIMFEPQRKH